LDAELLTSGDYYCPSDLFSQDQSRILKALRALYQLPRNNFKIFCRRKKPTIQDVSKFLEISSVVLANDKFLSRLSLALLDLWSLPSPSCESDNLLLVAACLRDCSFILGIDCVSEKYLIRMIDYDGKKWENLERYKSERSEIQSIIKSFSSGPAK
jgi:hypothetical protein